MTSANPVAVPLGGGFAGDPNGVEFVVPANRTIKVSLVTNNTHLSEKWTINGYGKVDGEEPAPVPPPGHAPDEMLRLVYSQAGTSGTFNTVWPGYGHELYFQVSCITKRGWDYVAHAKVISATPSRIVVGIDGTEDVSRPPVYPGEYNDVVITFDISPPI